MSKLNPGPSIGESVLDIVITIVKCFTELCKFIFTLPEVFLIAMIQANKKTEELVKEVTGKTIEENMKEIEAEEQKESFFKKLPK